MMTDLWLISGEGFFEVEYLNSRQRNKWRYQFPLVLGALADKERIGTKMIDDFSVRSQCLANLFLIAVKILLQPGSKILIVWLAPISRHGLENMGRKKELTTAIWLPSITFSQETYPNQRKRISESEKSTKGKSWMGLQQENWPSLMLSVTENWNRETCRMVFMRYWLEIDGRVSHRSLSSPGTTCILFWRMEVECGPLITLKCGGS